MFHAKFEYPSTYSASDIVPSMLEYSVHAPKLAWLHLVKYVALYFRYDIEMFHAKVECPSMYTA